MSKQLQTPSGYIVEDRPEGLFLIGDTDKAAELVNDEIVTQVLPTGLVRVEIGNYYDGAWYVNEYGQGHSLEEAMRYALGHALGSYEDPEVNDEEREESK